MQRLLASAAVLLALGCAKSKKNLDLELLDAASRGQTSKVAELLDAGAEANPSLAGGSTPLLLAAAKGRADTVRLLLERGAKPDARLDKTGATPLIEAVVYHHPDVVRILLEHGADPAARDAEGQTAQDWARGAHFSDVERLFKTANSVQDRVRSSN